MAPGAVERQHQLLTQALAERVLAHQGTKLGNEHDVAPTPEVGLDAFLDCIESQFLHLPAGVACPGLSLEIGQRPPSPKLERSPELLARLLCIAVSEQLAPMTDEAAKPFDVDLLGIDIEYVPGRARSEDFCTPRQGPPQSRDMRLQGSGGVRRRCRSPERLDETIARNDPVGVQEEQDEDAALLVATKGHDTLAVSNFERSEQSEVQRQAQKLTRRRYAALSAVCQPSVAVLTAPSGTLGGITTATAGGAP